MPFHWAPGHLYHRPSVVTLDIAQNQSLDLGTISHKLEIEANRLGVIGN
jgi:hypothetical protein